MSDEAERLRAAIRKHRNQTVGHGMCHENDAELWLALGEPDVNDHRPPSWPAFLYRCIRYRWGRRGAAGCCGGACMLEKAPQHLRENEKRLKTLREIANGFACRYGRPVYLVGSELLDFNSSPRDWDLRMPMPEHQFAETFGSVDQWVHQGEARWRWAGACLKLSREAWVRTGLPMDVQILPMREWERFASMPKFRLDEAPAYITGI